jgi:hypothetical protein
MDCPHGETTFEGTRGTVNPDDVDAACAGGAKLIDAEMAEISILVPADEAAAIETLARSNGVTFAQFVRRALSDWIAAKAVSPWDSRIDASSGRRPGERNRKGEV